MTIINRLARFDINYTKLVSGQDKLRDAQMALYCFIIQKSGFSQNHGRLYVDWLEYYKIMK